MKYALAALAVYAAVSTILPAGMDRCLERHSLDTCHATLVR